MGLGFRLWVGSAEITVAFSLVNTAERVVAVGKQCEDSRACIDFQPCTD